ncbi:hypothetical protein MNBD_CHLOROFLEXI01-5029 [hydrothermal vent metagenome]|uniref:Uncharacterized protein n=1 Tax=hydrothermal vent metagenome TaxID=652676 RepID=A0A3B0UU33_9ZZZZ
MNNSTKFNHRVLLILLFLFFVMVFGNLRLGSLKALTDASPALQTSTSSAIWFASHDPDPPSALVMP